MNSLSCRLGLKCTLPEGEIMDWELTEKMIATYVTWRSFSRSHTNHPQLFLQLPTPDLCSRLNLESPDTALPSPVQLFYKVSSSAFLPLSLPCQNSPSLDDTMSMNPSGILISDIFFIQKITPASLNRISSSICYLSTPPSSYYSKENWCTICFRVMPGYTCEKQVLMI